MSVSKKLLLFICLLPLPAQAGLWDYVASGVAGAAGMLAGIAKKPTLVVGLAATVGITAKMGMRVWKQHKKREAFVKDMQIFCNVLQDLETTRVQEQDLEIAEASEVIWVVNQNHPSEKTTIPHGVALMSATFKGLLDDLGGQEVSLSDNLFMILQDLAIQNILQSKQLVALKAINHKLLDEENIITIDGKEALLREGKELEVFLKNWSFSKMYNFLELVHYMHIPVLEEILTNICADTLLPYVTTVCTRNILQAFVEKFPLFHKHHAIGNIIGQKIMRGLGIGRMIALDYPMYKIYQQDIQYPIKDFAINNQYLGLLEATDTSSTIHIIDFLNKREVKQLRHKRPIRAIALSNDSTLLVSGDRYYYRSEAGRYIDCYISVWNLVHERIEHQLKIDRYESFAISPDNQYVCVVLDAVHVLVWDLKSDTTQIYTYPTYRPCRNEHGDERGLQDIFIDEKNDVYCIVRDCFFSGLLKTNIYAMQKHEWLWKKRQNTYIYGSPTSINNQDSILIRDVYDDYGPKTKQLIIEETKTGKEIRSCMPDLSNYPSWNRMAWLYPKITSNSQFIGVQLRLENQGQLNHEMDLIEIWGHLMPEWFKNASFDEAVIIAAYIQGHKTLKEIDYDFKAMVSDDVRQILGSIKK